MPNLPLLAYYIGIAIVFLSHIVVLFKIPLGVAMPSMQVHSIANIAAACMIAYYFIHTKGRNC